VSRELLPRSAGRDGSEASSLTDAATGSRLSAQFGRERRRGEGGAVPWRDYGSGVKGSSSSYSYSYRKEEEKYEAGSKASAGRRSKSQLCSAAGRVRREKEGGRAHPVSSPVLPATSVCV
jgi:hypothetical protein